MATPGAGRRRPLGRVQGLRDAALGPGLRQEGQDAVHSGGAVYVREEKEEREGEKRGKGREKKKRKQKKKLTRSFTHLQLFLPSSLVPSSSLQPNPQKNKKNRYLPREKTRALIRELGQICGKGSLLAFDYLDADSTGVSSHEEIEAKEVPAPPGRGVFATLGHMVTDLGEPYLDAFPSGAEEQSKEVAEGTGWKVKEVLDPSEIGRRFFPGSEEEIQKAKVPVVSRTNGLATWEKT